MAYSVSDLNTSPVTYPRVGGGALSAVERKNLRVAPVGSVTATEDIKAHYTEIFNNHAKVQDNLLKQLNDIFGKTIPMDGNRHVDFTDFIKDVCVDSDRANDAYKFYGRQIIEQINQLGDYIVKARALLKQATEDFPQWIIDQLDILDGFSKEMNETFGFRYIYDENEDIWKLYEDDYTNATHTQFNTKPTSYDKLRAMEVQEYKREPVFGKKTIEVFNELNLMDRLKYIKLYYDIDSGKTDALFPNDKVSGVPIVKEASSTNVIGAIEQFFMGYLIDRDGPVNAVSSYLEVKSAALVEKIRLESKKIEALNVYLKFINRALDVLNASQDGWEEQQIIGTMNRYQIPEGAMIGLMYLCGCNMYPLAEAADGTKCLVLEGYVSHGQYLLISADDAGMNCLLGDRADANDHRGNCCFYPSWNGSEKLYFLDNDLFSDKPATYHCSDTTSGVNRHNDVRKNFGKTFVPSPPIEDEKILPTSVKHYSNFNNKSFVNSSTYSSWQKAFQDKISFINMSIDTVNADIKAFRNKVDTLNTLSNTFRNRTHTAYMKVASNLRK